MTDKPICTCEKFSGITFRPALSSPADNPVLVRVCPACDLPILGMGEVVVTTVSGWVVHQRKTSMTLLRRALPRGRRLRS